MNIQEYIDKRKCWIALFILVAGTLWLYAPTAHFEFLNYDDNNYVYANSSVQKGITASTIHWAFTTFFFANWHPLTWLSYMLDRQLFGVWAGGYHLVNVAFHVMNVALLFYLFSKMTGAVAKSFLLAAIFAWHPVKVESVAWIAERKDVLSTFFLLLAILSYRRFVEQKKVLFYLVLILSYTLSLMSKGMYVTLPIILWIFDFWPLRRNEKPLTLLFEKIPLIVIALISSLITLRAQRIGGAVHALPTYPLTVNIETKYPLLLHVATVAHAYWDYLRLFFWPVNLSIFFPFTPNESIIQSLEMGLALVLISFFLFLQRKNQSPLFAGWFLFWTSLLPVCGIVAIGAHSVASRYLYWPATGLSIILIWGAEMLAQSLRIYKSALTILAVFMLAALFWMSSGYLDSWENNFKLFYHALEVAPDNSVPHISLRSAYFYKGNRMKAAEQMIELMRLQANIILQTWVDYYWMGRVYLMRGERKLAYYSFVESFRRLQNIHSGGISWETEEMFLNQLHKCVESMKTRKDDCDIRHIPSV